MSQLSWSLVQVDLTLHGHHHSYQRTCPVIAGKCQGAASTLTTLNNSNSNSDSSSALHDTKKPVGAHGFGHATQGSGTRGGHSPVYVDAAAPVHLVIGNAGAELSLNVELWPPSMWQVSRLPASQ